MAYNFTKIYIIIINNKIKSVQFKLFFGLLQLSGNCDISRNNFAGAQITIFFSFLREMNF